MSSAITNQEVSAGPERVRLDLEQILQETVDAGIVGMTLGVNDEHGEWVGRAGVRELGEPAAPPIDGHMRIGSNTKTFTATVVLLLVAENKIGLDTPVAEYLPEFDLDARVTVRMLLQHTSGIFNFTGEYYPDGTVVAGTPATTSGKEWVDNRFTTYEAGELVRLALSKPARFEPGTDWSYSNTNYALAKLVIERVTGRSFAEEAEWLILRPLGLSDTVVPQTSPELPEPYAHAYYRYEENGREVTLDVTRHNPSWISNGGDMISTTADLRTFICALVSGKLVPAELLAEMFTPYATPIPKMGYGLGVFVQETDGGTLITHNGGAAGHAGLMYSTLDGSRTLTASLNYVDDPALSMAVPFQEATRKLVKAVFG